MTPSLIVPFVLTNDLVFDTPICFKNLDQCSVEPSPTPMIPMFDNDDQAIDLVALSIVFPESQTAENESYMHVKGIAPIE